jgi:hypothetical protein
VALQTGKLCTQLTAVQRELTNGMNEGFFPKDFKLWQF